MRTAAAAFAIVVATALSAAAQDDGSAKEWSQPRGDAARSGCVDVAPMLGQPVVAWRRELPGPPVSSPVTWQGVVYVAARTPQKDISLIAVQASTGDVLATLPIGKGDIADLAVSGGIVFAVKPESVRSYKLNGKYIYPGWTSSNAIAAGKSSWAGNPAIARRTLFVPGALAVRALDLTSGHDALPPETYLDSYYSAMCVGTKSGDAADVARMSEIGWISACRATKLLTKAAAWDDHVMAKSPYSPDVSTVYAKPQCIVLAVLGDGWFAACSENFVAKGDPNSTRSIVVARNGDSYGCYIEHAPAVVDSVAYGIAHEGSLISVEPNGKYRQLVEARSRPTGARAGPAAAARGVLYLTNWALEIASGRVLWCLPAIDPVTPLIPCGDGRAICVDSANFLVGFADPSAAPAAEPGTDSKQPAAALEMPGDRDGALLPDGRFVAGTTKVTSGGRVLVAPANGATLDFAPGEFALAQSGAATLASDEERVVLGAWQEILDSRSVAAWESVFRRCADAALLTDALEALSSAKRDGLSEQRARELEKLLAGRRENRFAEQEKKRLAPVLRGFRDTYLADVHAASLWCAERGQRGAAAALLVRIRSERPADPDCEQRARVLLPPGFPFASAADAGQRWIGWAAEIVPGGGEFVPPDAQAAMPKRQAPWASDVVLLRSRNVLLVSRSADPSIVGRCLRHAEGAIRACQSVLGPPSAASTTERMEVRLHRDRRDYMAESVASGNPIGEWTAGYYSHLERVSRFYVPGADETAATPMELGLLRVLAHEVTHQWIDLRWEPDGGANAVTPGYWVVEGTARFIEEQSVEMGRRQGQLDDVTVSSLDIAAQFESWKRLSPLGQFLSWTHQQFDGLADEPKIEVRMRNTARIADVSARSLFYEQAGSLVFWLVTKRGDAGRAAFVEYLRQRYRGRFAAAPEKILGFASAAEMDRQFCEFLAGLRR